jgi:hypothetical protein
MLLRSVVELSWHRMGQKAPSMLCITILRVHSLTCIVELRPLGRGVLASVLEQQPHAGVRSTPPLRTRPPPQNVCAHKDGQLGL